MEFNQFEQGFPLFLIKKPLIFEKYFKPGEIVYCNMPRGTNRKSWYYLNEYLYNQNNESVRELARHKYKVYYNSKEI